MKKASLLTGLIFLILSFSAQGQIVTKYQQGFEATGETQGYTVVSGTATPVTSVATSGSRSLKLQHGSTETVIQLDTIDFTDNGSFQYFYLDFMHICDVDPQTCASATNVATVEVRRPNETDWTRLDGTDFYDVTWGGGSSDFASLDSYSQRSYNTWSGTLMNNTWWKRERFMLALKVSTVPLAERKLLIRFRLRPRTDPGTTTSGWYLDNIKVQCSPNSMLLPVITMHDYPDLDKYPTSRATHLKASFQTQLTQGMCNDSVYVSYQLGSDGIVRRKTMTPIAGQTGTYEAYLPFCGYDTIVKWRITGKDNSVNHNETGFPADASGWMQYSSVRGKEAYSSIATIGDWDYTPGTTNTIPFPSNGDSKSEILFDSLEMSRHFGPGAITQIRYPVVSNVTNSVRNRVVIKMRNVANGYAYSPGRYYSTDFQKTVYDSSLTITQNAQTLGVINLQDTFFYAGKGLMLTFYTDNTNSDPTWVNVRTYNSLNTEGKGSLTKSYGVSQNVNVFTSSYFNTGNLSTTRPNFTLRVNTNPPLMYDCGVGGFIHPNDSTPGTANVNDNVIVTLKNYGVQPINAVRIYYSVDNGPHQYFDWAGTLAGGAQTNVTVSSTQQYAAGYHELLAWVDDSVTTAGVRYRDHEPFNDTLWTRFITCDGPMHGTRIVGGSTPDYASLEKLLFALSQCGVDGPLTVKLAPGYYTPHTFPVIPGISKNNYVQFEPLGSGTVTFVSATGDTALVNSLVNLQRTHHVRFKKINFLSNSQSNPATYLVRMGTNSVGCQFDSCTFSEVQGGTMSESYMASSALLYSGGADSLVITNNTFNRGTMGLSLVGPAQDNMAHGSIVRGNLFQHQGTNSMVIRNQIAAVVDSNVCNEVYANSSYAILLQDCSGATRVTRNTVYVTSGASCIGATQLYGSATGYAVVANNMLVSNDDGTSNMLTTPLNIITANYAKVIFNSVKLTAPTRSGIAAATFGGGVLENSMFYNNIVACYDTVNFAFNYIPTEDAVNNIGYNIYYSRGPLLNKYDGINCLSFANWQNHCPTDGNSQNVNPAFLGSSLTDLRSYSQNVKGHAVPFAEVDVDIYGTQRNATAPCVGAFEFSSLPYDFEIIEFVEPYPEYCDVSSTVPLRVVIKNSGVNAYDPATSSSSVQLSASRGTVPGVLVPGVSGTMVINRVIPALDTIILTTNISIPFPTQGMNDTTYQLYAWLTSLIDPNPANDTSVTSVTSRYHAPAPDSISVNSDYGVPATVTATGGLQTWYSNVYTTSTQHKSEVYWYTTADSDTPIWRGNTFTTDPLYTDTTFYIRQKRDYPLVKITEVQIKQNQPGVTYPMPLWMNASTAFAIEFTNVGDYPANMEGDTVLIVSNQNANNNKKYRFPNVTIQPGASLVLQYRSGINNLDSTKTIGAMVTLTPQQNSKLGILYIHNGKIEDAVALNDTVYNNWTNLHVPRTAWFGNGIMLPDSIPTAGVYRTSWPQYPASLTPSATMWQRADDSHRMTLGTTNKNLIRFYDNGCLGETAPVRIHLINLPNVDMAVDGLDLSDGCGIGNQPITVALHNRGAYPSGELVVHYRVDGHPQYNGQAIALQTGCDTLTAGVAASSTLMHTFSAVPNFTVASASVDFDVTVWVEKVSVDNTGFNDTVRQSLTSMYMPGYPNVSQYDTVVYDGTLTLQSITTPTDSLAWYDRNMMPLDTSNVYTTDHIYEDDTMYVTAFGARIEQYAIGTLASLNAANSYPSPYNPNKKYVKEQYLYTAAEMQAAGLVAGPIQTVSFYLDTVLAPSGTFSLTDYVISFGTTSQATFTGQNNWLPVTPMCTIDTLTLSNSNKGWVIHNLNTAFHWNGVDNVVVQITRTVNPNITQGARTRFTAAANKVLIKNDNNNSVVDFTGNGSRGGNRPDIRFGHVGYGCEGPAMPIYITVTDIPASDASLAWTDSEPGTGTGSGSQGFTSCDSTMIGVTLRNRGVQSFDTYTIDYWIDTLHGVYNGTTAVPSDTAINVSVVKHLFTPGRHLIKLAVTLEGDTVQSNDTISRMVNVRFCAGTYAIGPNGLYPDFTTAIDTLVNAGIDGAVVFDVESGTYNEQITLGAVDGVSATNTVTFKGVVNDKYAVKLRYATTNNDNYVVKFDGAKFVNFQWMTIMSRGTGNYNNVVSLENSNQIHLDNSIIRVKGGVSNVNASGVIVGEGVTSLYLTNTIVDSGYYSIRSMVSNPGLSQGIYLTNDTLCHFMFMGLYMRKVDDVYAVGNLVTSGASGNGKALTGVFVAQHNGPATIERNNIILSDNFTGAKVGIRIVNVEGSNATRTHIHNNMCAIYGNTNNSSVGISIDSSTWANIYFNSCQVYAGTGSQGQNTKAMYVGTTSSGMYILNNIFSNISAGYSLYAQMAANITNSDYNDYWSSAEDRLAYWGTNCDTFLILQQTNGMDNHSLNEKPYFVSNTDLHLSIGNLCERAQYNTETPLDLDQQIRPQIPNPTIGADEFFRKNHNIAIMEITKPGIKTYATQVSGFTDNVESDTLWVVTKFTNDGTSTESNLRWWAQIKDVTPTLRSTDRIIDELLPQESIVDSNYIVMPIGVIDTQTVVVYFPLVNDSVPENNVAEKTLFLDPAYNFMAEQVRIYDSIGCRLFNTPVGIKLKNVGRKAFPGGWQVPVGFQAILQTPDITVSTLPVSFVENLTLPYDIEPNESVILDFNTTPNLYPTGNDKDIVVRIRAWSQHQYDQKPLNDTTSYQNVNSYYTPRAPIGTDLHIPYATWDTIFATQTDYPPSGAPINRIIRWHRDSTEAPYFTANNYARSCWWETPQYFFDSTYYLSTLIQHTNFGKQVACTSYYNPVHVILNPRVPVDMAVLNVVEPVKKRVYMHDDSVKVSLINYGSQAATNIPVVYQLYSFNNTLLQEVREVCTATVQPDSIYVFRFDSLLSIPQWSNTYDDRYKLRVWTDLPNESVRLNDTLRELATFTAGSDGYMEVNVTNKQGLDITRVAYSSMDNNVSPAGHKYINFTNASLQTLSVTTPQTLDEIVPDYNGNADVQSLGSLKALHLIKGTVDTMIVECQNSDKSNDVTTRGWLSVWVDVNRDGHFEYMPLLLAGDSADYTYPYTEIFYQDTITSNTPKKFIFTLPEDVRTGYMRMRVVVDQNNFKPVNIDNYDEVKFGCVHDYLLYIEDRPTDVDICAARIVSPRGQQIGGSTGEGADDSVTVSFQIANKGRLAVNGATVNYAFRNLRNGSVTGSIQWNGTIEPGHSAVVDLPQHLFRIGVTNLTITVSTPGDTNGANDTLYYQYYRAPIKTLIYTDNFDELSDWFIPRGYTPYSENLWQIGRTQKPHIMSWVSDSNILTTNLTGYVNVAATGNVSYAYTPIFDISTIRPDTLQLYVARDMVAGHLSRLEFCDYSGQWITVGSGNDSAWYNRGTYWDSTTAGAGYELLRFPLSLIAGDFRQQLQFRLVYKAEVEAASCDGIAFDNFVVGRARRPIDVGVIAITYPTHPKFGQSIHPRVVVKNFGLDTLREFNLAYLPYGVNLSRTGTYRNEEGLMPGATDFYVFPTPFIVRNDFPDTFQICAFTTVNMDMYPDNDSVCSDFYLSPLDNDMGAISFIDPLERVVAGDSITVTARLRNFGQAPVHSVTATYIYNGNFTVTEEINFEEILGHDLESFEYFNYSFKQKFRASMGNMNLVSYIQMQDDDYIYNDTISMKITGLSAITDLKAREIVVDTTDQNTVKISLLIENVGARGVNNFKIGFWYYKDTNTRTEYVYNGALPLPALGTLCYKFPDLPTHSEYYKYVTAYVYTDDDSDRTNDTTSVIVAPYVDLRPLRVLIEENRTDSCRVRVEVANVGNVVNHLEQTIDNSVTINGVTIKANNVVREVQPGGYVTIDFKKKVPKSPTRTYNGQDVLSFQGDYDLSNNTTTNIVVLNYFEGVPLVSESDGMVLRQNYPNPFDNTTRIEFYLPTSGDVRFFVMDELGRLVHQDEQFYSSGNQSITFGSSSLTTGTYYYGIEKDGMRLMRKMVLKR